MDKRVFTVKTDDFEMDYITFGTGGRAFVIIPGMSMKKITLSAAAIAGGFRSFADKYTIYVFDRINNMPQGYSVHDMANDTACAMKMLGISDADMFGASQGGMIAQHIAIDYPELVHGLVLGSTMSRNNDISLKTMNKWIEMADKKDYAAINRDMFYRLFSDEFVEKYGKVINVMAKEGNAEECERFKTMAYACMGFDVYDSLERIKCPVLVIGAENDKALGGDASREMAKRLGCEIYMYEKYGHGVYDEAPDYRDRMLEFFEGIK